MTRPGILLWLLAFAALPPPLATAQSQSCPVNINFSDGTLNHWQAYTGNNKDGNGPTAIKTIYDSSESTPGGTRGATTLPEYNLPEVTGIRVITQQGTDVFGGFPMIPTINGYAYQYSILLGSTSVTNRQASDPSNNPPTTGPTPVSGAQGGYVRGISFLVDVPPGPVTAPYTMTYAYAMVLENGTHASLDQPMARAIVSTPAGPIDCASPEYYLPTLAGVLDSATARANGFLPSPVASPNASPNIQTAGQHLMDIWTKDWTEVTFDLSAYRGQRVTLSFEADNCVPGGHFAYAYFALRNVCGGLAISGDTLACSNSVLPYSVPALDGASYDWSAPPGWIVKPGATANTVHVTIGPESGWIVAKEKNGCTNLSARLFVHLYKGALPQSVIDPRDTTVCYGESVPLHAFITTGTSYSWTNDVDLAGNTTGTIPSLPFAVNTVVGGKKTSTYILTIRNADCPVVVADSFTVAIVPPIGVDPGHDTLVVIGQPLQFHAVSSDPYEDSYHWSPATGLSDPDIANPIGHYDDELTTISYQVIATDSFGCSGAATVKVTIAHTLPDVFVPNAFTPGAGSNSLFRPVCIGISSLRYFQVFNRWGQRVYSTSQMGQGWDGRVQGRLQESDAYMWIVQGTDYTGRVITKKGTMVLIR